MESFSTDRPGIPLFLSFAKISRAKLWIFSALYLYACQVMPSIVYNETLLPDKSFVLVFLSLFNDVNSQTS